MPTECGFALDLRVSGNVHLPVVTQLPVYRHGENQVFTNERRTCLAGRLASGRTGIAVTTQTEFGRQKQSGAAELRLTTSILRRNVLGLIATTY
jgi:hypothetical protein